MKPLHLTLSLICALSSVAWAQDTAPADDTGATDEVDPSEDTGSEDTEAPAEEMPVGEVAVAEDASASDDVPGDEAWWDDESLVVTVETEGGVPRVAGSAHVIGEEELERHEYNDIHQVLATVPGVYVRGEDGFGLRPNIGLRGANSDRSAKITLMEDGILLAPAPYAAPAAYYFPMTTRMVGVEVFKGASATRHGPNTIGGALNLLTRPVPTEPSFGLDVAGGNYRTLKIHGFGGTGGERWGILAEGVHLGTEGFKELDGGGPTGFVHDEFMLKAIGTTDPERTVVHTFELKGGYTFENSHETYLGLTLDDFDATPLRRYAASQDADMRWNRTQAEASWIMRAGTSFDLRTVAYHHYLDRAWTKLNRFRGGPDLHTLLQNPYGGQAAVYMAILRGEEDTLTEDQQLMIGTNDRQYHSFGVQSVGHWRTSGSLINSQLEFGLRVHGDIVDRFQYEDPFAMVGGDLVRTEDPTLVNTDSRATAVAVAAHIHEDLGIGRFRLTPGMRLEAIGTTLVDQGEPRPEADWTVVPLPGIGMLAEVIPEFNLFGGIHRGFSPVAPGSPAGTKPESAINYEAGGRLDWFGTRAEAVGFFNDYSNFTGQCTISSGCTDEELDTQFNAGRVFVWGLEAMLGHDVLLPHDMVFSVGGAYTYTGSSFRNDFVSGFPQFGRVQVGDELPYVPKHQGSMHATFTHPRFSATVNANLRGAMRDQAGQGPYSPTTDVPFGYRLDFAADALITRQVKVYVNVNNFTNAAVLESWRPFGARPSMPFQFIAGIKLGLGGAQHMLDPVADPVEELDEVVRGPVVPEPVSETL